MNFQKILSFFKFSRQQSLGLFFVFLVIILFQCFYFFVDFNPVIESTQEKEKWMSLQSEIDSMKQIQLKYVSKTYPFNPNFITDYKAYKLGMTVVEIDRLVAFRKNNKFVNSPKEFQKVTKVSDSLLKAISPYFKFPDWVNNKKQFPDRIKYEKFASKINKISIIDINQATETDLIKINGIGEVISSRILTFKESLGGFVSMEQMQDIWGLSPDVIEKLNLHFKILSPPILKKIDINNATLKELSAFPYFRYPIPKNIVIYRSMNGDLKNFEDLTKIKGLSIDKAKIIALYLDFKNN